MMMTLELLLRQVGNSMMITVPQTILQMYDISDGDKFGVEINPDYLILKCKRGGLKTKVYETITQMTVRDKLEGVVL